MGCLRTSVLLGLKIGKAKFQSPHCRLTLDPNCHFSACGFPDQTPQGHRSFLPVTNSQQIPLGFFFFFVLAVQACRAKFSLAHISLWLVCRKHQQYDCKWYIPLADLVFPSPEESEASPQVHPFPDHELEDMKMKISALKSEIQKEVSRAWHLNGDREGEEGPFPWGPLSQMCQGGRRFESLIRETGCKSRRPQVHAQEKTGGST